MDERHAHRRGPVEPTNGGAARIYRIAGGTFCMNIDQVADDVGVIDARHDRLINVSAPFVALPLKTLACVDIGVPDRGTPGPVELRPRPRSPR